MGNRRELERMYNRAIRKGDDLMARQMANALISHDTEARARLRAREERDDDKRLRAYDRECRDLLKAARAGDAAAIISADNRLLGETPEEREQFRLAARDLRMIAAREAATKEVELETDNPS